MVVGAVFVVGVSCNPSPGADDAVSFVRALTELRMASNEQKRGPLEQLRGVFCVNVDVCEARDACVDAYEHHVRGVESGVTLRNRLDADLGFGQTDAMSALLLEMNIEIEEGKRLMPLCEQRVSAIRKKYKI